jgi:hypothetical protein
MDVVSVTPQPLYTPGKVHPVPIGQDAVWPSESVWDAVEKRKIFAKPVIELRSSRQ